MGLQAYRAKRDFERTREPRGETPSTEGHSFVVQEHAARRLHYDLRLELDGVLKSWAVTRGPSLVPGEKRLAVEVEDHPIEYGGFEGTIPEGEYGAGPVIIWDRGVWEPIGDPREGLAKGHLDFRLHGEKLKGRWALIRMAPRRGMKRNLWLLIKARDEEAREASDPDILTEAPRSVVSGREIEEVGEDDAVWNSRSSGRRGEDKATASIKAAPKRARKSGAASRAKARPAAVAAKAAPKRLAAADPPTAPVKTVGRAFAVKLTHPDRVYWPDVGLTKQGLAEYYADVWKWIAPHIVARPLALVRCPDGVGDKCFFQKHPWRGLPKSVSALRNKGSGGDFLAIEGLDGLIALVQGGVLEIHPWGSTVGDLEHPDRLLFDLDPGPRLDWTALIDAALKVRERLARDGIKSFFKTSGGKGLHVVAPLRPQADWDSAEAYAKSVAEAMAKDDPDRYTAAMSKAARDHRIFIDYLRNVRGTTAVAPYSTRARAGAPVSAPLAWSELGPNLRGDSYTVGNIRERLSRLTANPWATFFKLEQRLPAEREPARRKLRAKPQ